MDASRFSARMTRTPPGSDSGSATQLMEPFCTPWLPAPRVTKRQRASRYSMERLSACPIRHSEPVPEVKRTLIPREA